MQTVEEKAQQILGDIKKHFGEPASVDFVNRVNQVSKGWVTIKGKKVLIGESKLGLKMIQKNGTTTDPQKAAFITTNGKLVKGELSYSMVKEIDPNQTEESYFRDTHHIGMSFDESSWDDEPYDLNIHTAHMPTDAQMTAIKNIEDRYPLGKGIHSIIAYVHAKGKMDVLETESYSQFETDVTNWYKDKDTNWEKE